MGAPTFVTYEEGIGEARMQEHPELKRTDAEDAAGLTLINQAYAPTPINVLRYGIVPNDASAAANNSVAFKALVSINTVGPIGELIFPPIIGSDVYHFSDLFAFRDGIHVNLCGCTVRLSKTAEVGDTATGLFSALRDFSCQNGSIDIDYDMDGVSTSAGSAIHIGSRSTDSADLGTIYDSLLASPMGNVKLRKLKITTNNPGGSGIELVGGLQNVSIEDVEVDGQGVAFFGITYEFGWATSGTANLRQTSHMNNFSIRNFKATSLDTTDGYGIVLGGAYNGLLENVKVTDSGGIISCTPGESLFYRPWALVDVIGAKRTIRMHNIVGQDIAAIGIDIRGAIATGGGYLDSLIDALGHPADYAARTDLADYVLDGFVIDGTDSGYGILCSAGRADIRNGRITGFQHGLVGTDEYVNVQIEAVDAIGCTRSGINLDFGANVYATPRLKSGYIRNCKIAGNSTSSTGAYPGLALNDCDGIVVENNQFGFILTQDGVAETTQGNGVQLGANALNVLCRANRGCTPTSGNYTYYQASLVNSFGNTVDNGSGDTSVRGLWDGVLTISTAITITAATPGNLSVTLSQQVFEYTKRGSKVDYTFRIETSAFTHTTAAGAIRITNLPYTVSSAAGARSQGALTFSGLTKAGYTQFTVESVPGQAYLEISACGTATARADVAITDFPTGGAVILRGSGHYFV